MRHTHYTTTTRTTSTLVLWWQDVVHCTVLYCTVLHHYGSSRPNTAKSIYVNCTSKWIKRAEGNVWYEYYTTMRVFGRLEPSFRPIPNTTTTIPTTTMYDNITITATVLWINASTFEWNKIIKSRYILWQDNHTDSSQCVFCVRKRDDHV
jgi:hypothetical protein